LLRKPDIIRNVGRALLLGGASFAAWAYLPKFARAADRRDPRLIVVILRGGSMVSPPCADRRSRLCRPAWFDRAGRLMARTRRHADSFFALHPSMPEFARCTARNTPRWFTRWRPPIATVRIFDGQDVLESGFAGPGRCNPAGSTARWKRCRRAIG